MLKTRIYLGFLQNKKGGFLKKEEDQSIIAWVFFFVFLIDDFVWSGSTLNETATKLKYEWVKEVHWFAFVWNMNLDYDVINEV